MKNINLNKIDLIINKIKINQIAKKCTFSKRKHKVISPKVLFKSMCAASLENNSSLNCISEFIGLTSHKSPSKQGVFKRLSENFLTFLDMSLKKILILNTPKKVKSKKFNRILVEDSTIVDIDPKFADVFPGAKNNSKKDFASLKIKTIYNASEQKFINFELYSFRNNDQSLSQNIIPILKPNDLVLRDLGFYKLDSFKKIQENGAFFLSRYKFNTSLFNLNCKQIDLLKLLTKNVFVDMQVLIGEKLKLPVRLIAIPLPENVVNNRRRKAQYKREKRFTPHKKRITLLKWNIFITNITSEKLTPSQITELYRVRWSIEVIFKTWKSHLNLKKLSSCSLLRLKIDIYIKLICIVFMHNLICDVESSLQKMGQNNARISILKFSNCFFKFSQFFFIPNISLINITAIFQKCLLENRMDRISLSQKVEILG